MANETCNITLEFDCKVAYFIQNNIVLYYKPILVILGWLGNCLSMYVFLGTKLRYSSSSIYLGALAINDSIFLLAIFIPWLDIWNVDIFNRQGFCQLIQYFGYVCTFLNAWLVVAFTIERYVAVKWPLRRQFLCTVVRAKMTVMGLTVSAILLNSPILYLSKLSEATNKCGSNENIKNDAVLAWLNQIYNILDDILSFVVPWTTIVIFNTLIARNIYKLDNIRRTLTIESNVSNDRAHASRDRMPQTKVTKMLLVVSTTFLCLNLPAVVIRIIIVFFQDKSKLWLHWAQPICQLLFYTSFGINFILYCASGQNFRREIVRMCGKNSRRSTASRILMTSHEKQCVTEFTRRNNLTKRQYSVETTLSTELSADAKTSSKRIMI